MTIELLQRPDPASAFYRSETGKSTLSTAAQKGAQMEGSNRFDEGATTAPLTRETPYGSQQQPPIGEDPGYAYGRPQGYGYGRWGGPRGGSYGGPRRRPIETRPFFLTSEFLVTVLAIVALGITAGAMDIVDARLTWILTAAMVFGYVLSRGLAKAGSQSQSFDPREELLQRGVGDGSEQQRHATAQQEPVGGGYAYGSEQGYGMRSGQAGGRRSPVETTPFFLTSEFLGTLLAVVAVALTAAAMDNLGARLTWILIAAMVFTYALSRGLAKAGTRSYSFDPREDLLRRDRPTGDQQPVQEPIGRPAMHAIETKPFFLTSEFLGTVLGIVAIAISAAAIDVLDVRLTWILITAMVCGYVLSRGIAKIGVRSHGVDPREELLRRAVESGGARREPAGQR
jgi:hypothetical protein